VPRQATSDAPQLTQERVHAYSCNRLNKRESFLHRGCASSTLTANPCAPPC
jgi:hypothetical protein